MKTFTLFLLYWLSCISMELSAQRFATAFQQGQIDLNFGIGVLPLLDPSVSLDFGVSDNFSVGVLAAYGGKHEINCENTLSKELKAYAVGVRALMHYTDYRRIDWYGGMMIGYKANVKAINQDLGKIFPGILTCIFGSRIHLNKHLGLYTELSYTGYSFISMGVNIKI